jgi:short-subunit dehydrogenase
MLAERLMKEHNCNVIGVARSEKKMLNFVDELGDYAKLFSYKLFDVSSYDNWQQFHDWLKENNIKPDVLINNAGVLPRFDRLMNYTKEEIDESINIDFYSAAYSSKIMLPLLMESETPAIINVASSAALMALGGTSMYSASKAAVKGLTEAMREELRGEAYIGLVCPGFTKTDIFRNQGETNGMDLINMVSTPCDKAVNRILKGILKKKSYIVVGFDGNAMGRFNRLMPVQGSRLFSSVIKMFKIDLFASTFGYEKKNNKK